MLLLDSQTALWSLDDNPKLGARSRDIITQADRVYISAATVWELTIKSMLGKISIPIDFTSRVAGQGFEFLSVTSDHAAGLQRFPELVRHDPFDRIIVSAATCEELELLTADQVLLDLKRDYILDSRL